MRFSPTNVMTILLMGALLSGCAGWRQDIEHALGWSKPTFNEKDILESPPLTVPPDFALRAPKDGSPPPSEQVAKAEQAAVLAGRDKAVAPIPAADAPPPRGSKGGGPSTRPKKASLDTNATNARGGTEQSTNPTTLREKPRPRSRSAGQNRRPRAQNNRPARTAYDPYAHIPRATDDAYRKALGADRYSGQQRARAPSVDDSRDFFAGQSVAGGDSRGPRYDVRGQGRRPAVEGGGSYRRGGGDGTQAANNGGAGNNGRPDLSRGYTDDTLPTTRDPVSVRPEKNCRDVVIDVSGNYVCRQ